MAYEVEVTDEWREWFETLTAEEQEEVAATIGLSEKHADPICLCRIAAGWRRPGIAG